MKDGSNIVPPKLPTGSSPLKSAPPGPSSPATALGAVSPSLEKLAELVRQAESRAKAQRLGADTKHAADALTAAEARAREAQRRVREERPIRQRELKQAIEEAKLLHDMTIKLAQHRNYLPPDANAERLIEHSRLEIESKRNEAQRELDSIAKEAIEAQRVLGLALEKYQSCRAEMDRLLPQLAAEFNDTDRMLSHLAELFPAQQIPALAAEIEDGAAFFGTLDSRQQKAQLMIWIGKLRRLQSMDFPEQGEEMFALEQIFRRLVSLSKQYMPGYIDAFQEGYVADWDQYIVDAQEQFRLAADGAARDRQFKVRSDDLALREAEKKKASKETHKAALNDLRAIIVHHDLSMGEGVDEFTEALLKAVQAGGASDPEMLELIRPFRELVTGSEFRVVRKHLDKIHDDEVRSEQDVAMRESLQGLIGRTRGLAALMIGGAAREDARSSLHRLFEFDDLDWVPYEGNSPAKFESVKARIKNHGVDLVLILKSLVAHAVPEQLRPLCQDYGIPCLMVEQGYGASQVAEAIRNCPDFQS